MATPTIQDQLFIFDAQNEEFVDWVHIRKVEANGLTGTIVQTLTNSAGDVIFNQAPDAQGRISEGYPSGKWAKGLKLTSVPGAGQVQVHWD